MKKRDHWNLGYPTYLCQIQCIFCLFKLDLSILCAFQFDLLITTIYEESSWYKAHKDTKIVPQIVTRLPLGREKYSWPILRIRRQSRSHGWNKCYAGLKAGLLGQADPAKSVQHITELGKLSMFEMAGQSHAALWCLCSENLTLDRTILI